MNNSRSVWQTLNRPAWWLIGLVLLLVAMALYFGLTRAPLDQASTVQAEIEITPIVGGTMAPTATPVSVAEPAGNGAVAVAAAADAEAVDEPVETLPIGQRVTLLPGQSLTLYAEPSTDEAPRMVYAEPVDLTVIEPSGNYAGYPVENEGQQWYRLRDENGLVGWVGALAIASSNEGGAALSISQPITEPANMQASTNTATLDAFTLITVERITTDTTLVITGSGPITGPQDIERVLITSTTTAP